MVTNAFWTGARLSAKGTTYKNFIFIILLISVQSQSVETPHHHIRDVKQYKLYGDCLLNAAQTPQLSRLNKSAAFPVDIPIQDSCIQYDTLQKQYLTLYVDKYINSTTVQDTVFSYSSSEIGLLNKNSDGFITSFVDIDISTGTWQNSMRLSFSPPQAPFFIHINPEGSPNTGDLTALLWESSLDSAIVEIWNAQYNRWENDAKLVNITFPDYSLKTSAYWEQNTNTWQNNETDTVVFFNGKIIEITFGTSEKFIGTYDDHGNQTKETSLLWDTNNKEWKINRATNYFHTYDQFGSIVETKSQDSTANGWVSIDSCCPENYMYERDLNGWITCRWDSIKPGPYNHYYSRPATIHYYKYPSTDASIHTCDPSAAFSDGIQIHPDGLIVIKHTTSTHFTITMFTVLGKSIVTMPVVSNTYIWDYCASHGIAISKGCYLVKIQSNPPTPQSPTIKVIAY